MRQASDSLPDLRISVFPPGDAVWRVDWFGPVDYPDRSARSAQPSVRVHLSRIADPARITDGAWLLSPAATSADAHQGHRYVSVGTTMLLRIGDLWRGQALLAKPEYELEEFREIEIGRDTVSVVKAGSSFDDGTFLIPLGEHPWHRANTHSYCVKVKLPDGRLLVVPAHELIRFYFGSSSGLLARLFTTGLKKQDLFTESDLERPPGIGTLALAAGIVRASAHDVARIAFSDAAWRAALLVSKSCLRASVRGADIYPQGVFPFEGRTTLQAKGKWLSQGGQERQTFLAYELRSCSHAFPYCALQYRLVDGAISEVGRKGDGASNAATLSAARALKPKSPRLDERDASKMLAPGTASVQRATRFPDLNGKPTFGQEHVEAELPLSAVGKPSSAVDAVAVGDAESYERVRAMSLVEARSRSPALNAPSFLGPLLFALDGFAGAVLLLTASEDDGWTVPIDLRSDPDGLIDESLFEGGRPRRVCIFRLTAPEVDCFLAAVEMTPAMFLIQTASVRADAAVADCMERAVAAVKARRAQRSVTGAPAPDVTGKELLAWLATWIGGAVREAGFLPPVDGLELRPTA